MKYLTAAEILSAPDLASEDVDVPEWGGTVKVRELSARNRQWFINNAIDPTKKLNGAASAEKPALPVENVEKPAARMNENAQAMLVSRSIVDENDALVFTDASIAALAEKSHAAMERVVSVAVRLSKLAPDAIKESEKNSVAAPSGDSSSV